MDNSDILSWHPVFGCVVGLIECQIFTHTVSYFQYQYDVNSFPHLAYNQKSNEWSIMSHYSYFGLEADWEAAWKSSYVLLFLKTLWVWLTLQISPWQHKKKILMFKNSEKLLANLIKARSTWYSVFGTKIANNYLLHITYCKSNYILITQLKT